MCGKLVLIHAPGLACECQVDVGPGGLAVGSLGNVVFRTCIYHAGNGHIEQLMYFPVVVFVDAQGQCTTSGKQGDVYGVLVYIEYVDNAVVEVEVGSLTGTQVLSHHMQRRLHFGIFLLDLEAGGTTFHTKCEVVVGRNHLIVALFNDGHVAVANSIGNDVLEFILGNRERVVVLIAFISLMIAIAFGNIAPVASVCIDVVGKVSAILGMILLPVQIGDLFLNVEHSIAVLGGAYPVGSIIPQCAALHECTSLQGYVGGIVGTVVTAVAEQFTVDDEGCAVSLFKDVELHVASYIELTGIEHAGITANLGFGIVDDYKAVVVKSIGHHALA